MMIMSHSDIARNACNGLKRQNIFFPRRQQRINGKNFKNLELIFLGVLEHSTERITNGLHGCTISRSMWLGMRGSEGGEG